MKQLFVNFIYIFYNSNGTKNWVQHGFISAQAVIRWWEGVIASAFSIAGGQVIVDRMYSVSI